MVSGEYPANHVLIDLNAEGQSNLLGDSGTTPQWIPLLHLDHGFNQFLGGSLRTGLGPGLGGEQQSVFSLFQRFVKVQESRRLQNDRGSDPAGWGASAVHTNRRSVGPRCEGSLAGTIVDQQLVLDKDGLGNNRAQASWTKEAEKRRDDMDKKDDDLKCNTYKADKVFSTHNHLERNHQGRGNALIVPIKTTREITGPVQYRQRLGGLLNYYYREAA